MDICEAEMLLDYASISIPRHHLRIVYLSGHEHALMIGWRFVCWCAADLVAFLDRQEHVSLQEATHRRAPGRHYAADDSPEQTEQRMNYGHVRHKGIPGHRGRKPGYLVGQ